MPVLHDSRNRWSLTIPSGEVLGEIQEAGCACTAPPADGLRWAALPRARLLGAWGGDGLRFRIEHDPSGPVYSAWAEDGVETTGEIKRISDESSPLECAQWSCELREVRHGGESKAVGRMYIRYEDAADGRPERLVLSLQRVYGAPECRTARRERDLRSIEVVALSEKLWVCPFGTPTPSTPADWLGPVIRSVRTRDCRGVATIVIAGGDVPPPPPAAGLKVVTIATESPPSPADVASAAAAVEEARRSSRGVLLCGEFASSVATAVIKEWSLGARTRAVAEMVAMKVGGLTTEQVLEGLREYRAASTPPRTPAVTPSATPTPGPISPSASPSATPCPSPPSPVHSACSSLAYRARSPSPPPPRSPPVSPQRVPGPMVTRDETRWRPDDSVNSCEDCGKQFHMFRRRHHCRHCGNLFCDLHSRRRARLLPAGGREGKDEEDVRVCIKCHIALRPTGAALANGDLCSLWPFPKRGTPLPPLTSPMTSPSMSPMAPPVRRGSVISAVSSVPGQGDQVFRSPQRRPQRRPHTPTPRRSATPQLRPQQQQQKQQQQPRLVP
eukprot:Hpha_TRINITY_DN16280_c1_g1::TRINITY_DN16280_c1_g1_i1::g.16168::m.16168